VSLPIFRYEDAAAASVGAEVVLDGPEGHHAAAVRRLRAGQPVVLTDGRGVGLGAEVTSVHRREVVLVVQTVDRRPRPKPTVTVVQAIPKGDRGELAVELMTEVGVDRLVPWRAERCISVWNGDKAAKGRAKWQSTADAAAKQSRRWWWPEVDQMVTTEDLIEQVVKGSNIGGLAFVLHEDAEARLAERVRAISQRADGDIMLVVGPEGGVSPSELQSLRLAGVQSVRLGPNVLRTSTAGAVAATLVLAGTERWAATSRVDR
jgi:16S rRNA (uracil1498-N3)-methyltransferase